MGAGMGFNSAVSAWSRADFVADEQSSESGSGTSVDSKAHKRMGWMQKSSKETQKRTKVESPRDLPIPPPPGLAQPTLPSSSSQSQSPLLTGHGRRRNCQWKGEVKSCTVIAEELRKQLTEDAVEESKKVHNQPLKKRHESMDWREALQQFRVP
ncbi:hypothetical protein AB5N19_11111 [Seiridium cardinale]